MLLASISKRSTFRLLHSYLVDSRTSSGSDHCHGASCGVEAPAVYQSQMTEVKAQEEGTLDTPTSLLQAPLIFREFVHDLLARFSDISAVKARSVTRRTLTSSLLLHASGGTVGSTNVISLGDIR